MNSTQRLVAFLGLVVVAGCLVAGFIPYTGRAVNGTVVDHGSLVSCDGAFSSLLAAVGQPTTEFTDGFEAPTTPPGRDLSSWYGCYPLHKTRATAIAIIAIAAGAITLLGVRMLRSETPTPRPRPPIPTPTRNRRFDG